MKPTLFAPVAPAPVMQLPLYDRPGQMPTSAPAPRNTTIELFRVLAAYGVIAVHIPGDTPAAGLLTNLFWPLCVPFFYITSLTFFVAGLRRASLPAIFDRSWRRIVVPYLAWTIVYIALLFTKSMVVHNGREFTPWRILFYGDSSIQLYFLSTLLMMQAFALGLHLLFTPSKGQRLTGGLLLLGATGYYAWGVYSRCYGVETIGSVVGVATYLIGAFMFAPIIHDTHNRRGYILVGCALIAVAVSCNATGNQLLFHDYPLVKPIGGIGTLLVAVGFPRAAVPGWVVKLASISFGIYLCHVLFIEAFEFAVERASHSKILYSLSVKVLEVTIVFLLSVAFTQFLRRVPLLQELFLGERSPRLAGSK